MKIFFLIFMLMTAVGSFGYKPDDRRPETPEEIAEYYDYLTINMQLNFCLIKSVRELALTECMKYPEIKPVSDYVINKLYEEKDLWLLTYFYCHIDNEDIKKDINVKIELLKTDIKKAIELGGN